MDRLPLQHPREKQLLVAFGSNQHFGEMPPENLIISAAEALGQAVGGEICLSGLYRTPCFPAGGGPDYINAAAKVTLRNVLEPEIFLSHLHEVEKRFGRERSARWASRTVDIDLLACGDTVLPDDTTHRYWRGLATAEQSQLTPERLILPHPRLQDRAFVLVPLFDVAPDWRHPILDRTVRGMLAALPAADRAEVVRLNPAASS